MHGLARGGEAGEQHLLHCGARCGAPREPPPAAAAGVSRCADLLTSLRPPLRDAGLFAGDPSLRTRFLAALRAGRADRGAAAAAASGGADAAKAKAKQLAPAVVGGDGAAHRHAA